jgi:MinD-like ATPase involved in chromosome partitioning or flagellar assembly
VARHDREDPHSLEEQLAWLDAIKESEEVPAAVSTAGDDSGVSPYPKDPWLAVPSEPAPAPPPMFRAAVDSVYGSSGVTVVDQADQADTIKVEESPVAVEASGKKDEPVARATATTPVTPPKSLRIADPFLDPLPKPGFGDTFTRGAFADSSGDTESLAPERLGAFEAESRTPYAADPAAADPESPPEAPQEPVRGWLEPAVLPPPSAAEETEPENDPEQERFEAFMAGADLPDRDATARVDRKPRKRDPEPPADPAPPTPDPAFHKPDPAFHKPDPDKSEPAPLQADPAPRKPEPGASASYRPDPAADPAPYKPDPLSGTTPFTPEPPAEPTPYAADPAAYVTDPNPFGNDPAPFGGQPEPPYSSEPTMFGGDPTPFSSDSPLFAGEALPFGGEPMPFGGDATPFGGDATPFGGEATTYESKSATYKRESGAYKPESGPYKPDPTPYDPESASASYDREPATYDPESASYEREPAAYEREAAVYEREPAAYKPDPLAEPKPFAPQPGADRQSDRQSDWQSDSQPDRQAHLPGGDPEPERRSQARAAQHSRRRPAPPPAFSAPARQSSSAKPNADSLDPLTLLKGRRNAPSNGWRRLVYKASAGWIKPGESPEVRRRRELVARSRTPVATGHHRVAVLSLKGGVGKTTTTVGLGATLAQVRGDRVIAVDANPDRGTLSDKVVLETSATVRDLLNERKQIHRYVDIRAFTSQSPSRLEILASDRDPSVSEAFSAGDYQSIAQILENFYSICITDCGTGLLHSAMSGVLGLADQLVLVSSPSVDGARAASATLDWLEAHHYGDLVKAASVVLCSVRPRSKSTVDLERLEAHFSARCRAVIRVPYDPHLEEGAEMELERLQPATREAYLHLAAAVGDGFASPQP